MEKYIPCRVCGAEAEFFDHAQVLGKYDIGYYHCPVCDFVETEEPHWLDEAYSSAITDTDIGLVGRNFLLAKQVRAVLSFCLPHAASFLDYGGGYGMFVRLMRDAGFPFEWYDKYSENLFAKHCEKKQEHYDVVTAFELLEHLPDPVLEIEKLLTLGDSVLFSEELSTAPPVRLTNGGIMRRNMGSTSPFIRKRHCAI